MNKEILTLSEREYFSSGVNRKCYIHPSNRNLCIKVPKLARDKKTLLEVSYLRKVKGRLKPKRPYFSDFLHTVETNKGKGYVFELILDYTGNVSKTLEHEYLNALHKDDFVTLKKLNKEIENLQKKLLIDKFIVTDLTAKNIVVKKRNNDFELVIIDGIGRTNFIPLLDRFGLVRQRKIRNCYNKKLKLIINNFILARIFFKKREKPLSNKTNKKHVFIT